MEADAPRPARFVYFGSVRKMGVCQRARAERAGRIIALSGGARS